jgi:hypothetical protein
LSGYQHSKFLSWKAGEVVLRLVLSSTAKTGTFSE